MKIVIAGGSGFLGGPLAEVYAEEGHEVIVLTRSVPSGESRHDPGTGVPGITRLGWTADGKIGPWAAIVEAADAVINLSGEAIDKGRWTPQRKAQLRDSRILATRSLAASILAAAVPPKVFVSGSAIGYYGDTGDRPMTESSPPGHDFLAQLCEDWEGEAHRAGVLRGAGRVAPHRRGAGSIRRRAAADDAAVQVLRRRAARIRTAVRLVDSTPRLGRDGPLDRGDARRVRSDQRHRPGAGHQQRVDARPRPRDASPGPPAGPALRAEARRWWPRASPSSAASGCCRPARWRSAITSAIRTSTRRSGGCSGSSRRWALGVGRWARQASGQKSHRPKA